MTEFDFSAGQVGEKCAVFGVFGQSLDVARLSFFGLYALQHRGQESAGIATGNGEAICLHKGMGLVSQVFTEELIESLKGHVAVAHNRYSTTGGSKVKHAQPMLGAGNSKLQKVDYGDTSPSLLDSISLCSGADDDAIALVHNGNLPSTTLLSEFLREKGIGTPEFSDSRMIVEAIAAFMREGHDLKESVRRAYPLLTGAFSILIMSKDTLIAIRDACGIRPLSIAQLNGGYVFASETCAFAPIGASYLRDVEPGEMVIVDEKGLRSEQVAAANPKLDIFEFVYFARPDSRLLGKSVYDVRRNCGIQLAKENTIEADVVIPVPETAIPAAIGFSQATGIPMEMGLTKNRYIHRTFIQPEQHIREQGVKAKLSPIKQIIEGKRVIVIDDSIVRGTTSRQIVAMLFEAGAKEVHFLVSSPPVKFPDFYGIDTPKQSALIAATKSVEEIQKFLGATSLRYLSYEGMIAATGIPEDQFSTSCFTGVYPIDIRECSKEIRY
ncbi:amidophosphoribosyltransferase [Candidatus Kaiserbacteria bacterium RIFCSPHIGHO2_02_FULL_59_21]|uniref:Amidophosphoribosyltransferase n=2 Tax=Candidatus Kaiseribacteriota TaxID=1752734 RepID=A0A0G2BN19_9BACT|nr:MAG: Amidophosphoribosyltransferase [Candidatus Kaiserbacteria bacterium GW2011_GWA2_58_9]OGG63157.1 MAG: amidophosphoribosyltransferase [Candidatus Kaiserbacteria bacterium RIFCSPHIGHO2_01_FULL_58_22]OGG66775.1 MAG: amidophosphoribosyltransferase [Candidatus Kaiserbacteria bacterium RIFCSPHIGHO2_02_FULL_59_21]OGG87096.1 MAG: amidophosphoribosyltransferase [Candidatus Kaiserbacteria bacterium RIFCSPLOWO2_02_FULL_59_19]